MKDQRGDRFIGLPFASPHRLGGLSPEAPKNEVYHEGYSHQKRHRFLNAHRRCAVSAIIVGTGVLDGPLSKLNVHLRYLKIKQLLLPNVKECRRGGIMKVLLGVVSPPSTDGSWRES